MAKQIKVIRCPNCGSVEKNEVKPEHYRCESCHTEYFLDNDDININVKHSSASSLINDITKNKVVVIALGIVCFFIVLALISIINKNSRPDKPPVTQITTSASPKTLNPGDTKQGTTKSETFKLVRTHYCSLDINNDTPYVIAIEELRSAGKSQYGLEPHSYHFMTYNLLNGKLIKNDKIDGLTYDRTKSLNLRYLDVENDKTYFIANDKTAYLLDRVNYKLNDVTQNLLKNHPDYQTGIASITFSYTEGAFHILTNDGKKLYYYPLIDEVYVDDYDFQMWKNRPKRPPADTSTHLAFVFANSYGKNNKLIKYEFISPDGKSHTEGRSSKAGASKLGGLPGNHSDEDSAYDLINTSNLDIKIISHQNLTPGRLYFDPSILYSDNNTLIIKTKVNAGPEANYNYQQIDINNGNVIWTLSDDLGKIEQIMPYKNNFIAKRDCGRYIIIGADGKIINKITLVE